MMAGTTIYVLSDSLGDTAEQVAKAAVSQFSDNFKIVKWSKITNIEQIKAAIDKAKNGHSVMFYTLVAPELSKFLKSKADEFRIPRLDVLGPAIRTLEEVSEVSPELKPGASRQMTRGYFQKIEALNFAVKHDDGRNINDIKEAEIVLLGVSRTSKTPLSVYLAYRGWKVANVPLIYGIEPPKQLFDIFPEKIVGLDIGVDLLRVIREQRLESVGSPRNGYANTSYISKELDYARSVMKKIGCRIIDNTHKAIEETASEILKYYNNHI